MASFLELTSLTSWRCTKRTGNYALSFMMGWKGSRSVSVAV